MTFQGCPDTFNDQAFIPPPGWIIALRLPPQGWWFKVIHWQHLQLLDNKLLKGGQESTSPCSPWACITAPEVGDEGVLWGKLLMTDV